MSNVFDYTNSLFLALYVLDWKSYDRKWLKYSVNHGCDVWTNLLGIDRLSWALIGGSSKRAPHKNIATPDRLQ